MTAKQILGFLLLLSPLIAICVLAILDAGFMQTIKGIGVCAGIVIAAVVGGLLVMED